MKLEIQHGILLGLGAAGILVLAIWSWLALTNTSRVVADEQHERVLGETTSQVTPVELYVDGAE